MTLLVQVGKGVWACIEWIDFLGPDTKRIIALNPQLMIIPPIFQSTRSTRI